MNKKKIYHKMISYNENMIRDFREMAEIDMCCLIYGDVGKKTFVRSVYPETIFYDARIFNEPRNLGGFYVIKDGNVIYMRGILHDAMVNGYKICFVNVDSNPGLLQYIRPILSKRRFVGNDGSEVVASSGFRIFLTASISINVRDVVMIGPIKFNYRNVIKMFGDCEKIVCELFEYVFKAQSATLGSKCRVESEGFCNKVCMREECDDENCFFRHSLKLYGERINLIENADMINKAENNCSDNVDNSIYLNDGNVNLELGAVLCGKHFRMLCDLNKFLHELRHSGDIMESNENRYVLYEGFVSRVLRHGCEELQEKLYLRKPTLVFPDMNFVKTEAADTALRTLICNIKLRQPTLLVGETGAGKTALIQYLNRNAEFFFGKSCEMKVVNMSSCFDGESLIGSYQSFDLNKAIKDFLNEYNQEKYTTIKEKKIEVNGRNENNNINDAMTINTKKGNYNVKQSNIVALKKIVEKSNDSVVVERARTYLRLLDNKLAFFYKEGLLTEAMRKGYWLLIDEINLAPQETLGLIEAVIGAGELILYEGGELERVRVHPDFMLFACMNPSGDHGKKGYDTKVFNRLIFMDFSYSLDCVRAVVHALTRNTIDCCEEISQFYVEFKRFIAAREYTNIIEPLVTGRTLCRALEMIKQLVYEGNLKPVRAAVFLYFFTQLDLNSRSKALDLYNKYFKVIEERSNRETNCNSKKEKNHNDINYDVNSYINSKNSYFDNNISNYNSNNTSNSDNFRTNIYAVTDRMQMTVDDIELAIRQNVPVLLQGDTSTGKTSLIYALAEKHGRRVVRINNHEHTDVADYLGNYVTSGRDIFFKSGPLVAALRNGWWVILDELNLAPSDVLEVLNRLLDDNREIYISEIDTVIQPHDDFRIFATQNINYGGRRGLAKSFRNRFVEIFFYEKNEKELGEILSRACQLPKGFVSKMTSVYAKLKVMRNIDSLVTLRDLFKWALRGPTQYSEVLEIGLDILGSRVRNIKDYERLTRVFSDVFSGISLPNSNVNFAPLDSTRDFIVSNYSTFSNNYLNNNNSVTDIHFFTAIISAIANNSNVTSLNFQPTVEVIKLCEGLVITRSFVRLIELIYKAWKCREPVLVVGETGIGKTRICEIVARLLGRQLKVLNMHRGTESSDFVGNFVFTDGEIVWKNGVLIDAMINGDCLLVDEINLAEDAVLERMNSVLEDRRTLYVTEQEHEYVAHPDFRIAATMNPSGDFGKREISPALRNRFTEIYFELHPDEYCEIFDALIDKRVGKDTAYFKNEFRKISEFLSVRKIELVVSHISNLRNSTSNCALVSIDSLLSDFVIWNDVLELIDKNNFENATEINNIKEKKYNLNWRNANQNNSNSESIKNNHELDDLKSFSDSFLQSNKFGIYSLKNVTSNNHFDFTCDTAAQNMKNVLRGLSLSRALLLQGEPGVGKTSIVGSLAQICGIPLLRINLSEQTEMGDLVGSYLPVGCEIRFVESELVYYLRKGWWVLLDEINLCTQSVIEGLNSMLDYRRTIIVNDEPVYVHDNTRIFATMNPVNASNGRKELPKSFKDRFVEIYMTNYTKRDITQILSKKYGKSYCFNKDLSLRGNIQLNELNPSKSIIIKNSIYNKTEDKLVESDYKHVMDDPQYIMPGDKRVKLEDKWVESDYKHIPFTLNNNDSLNNPCNVNDSSVLYDKHIPFTLNNNDSLNNPCNVNDNNVLYDKHIPFTLNNNDSLNNSCNVNDNNVLYDKHIPFTLNNNDSLNNPCNVNDNNIKTNNSDNFVYYSIDEKKFKIRNVVVEYCELDPSYVLGHGNISAIETFFRCVGRKLPMILTGRIGCSRFLDFAAKLLGLRLIEIDCHKETDTYDLLGQYCKTDSTEILFEWKDSPLITALQSPSLIVFNTPELVAKCVFDRLSSLFETERLISVFEKGADTRVSVSPDCVLCLYCDDVTMLSPALQDRCVIVEFTENFTTIDLAKIVNGAYISKDSVFNQYDNINEISPIYADKLIINKNVFEMADVNITKRYFNEDVNWLNILAKRWQAGLIREIVLPSFGNVLFEHDILGMFGFRMRQEIKYDSKLAKIYKIISAYAGKSSKTFMELLKSLEIKQCLSTLIKSVSVFNRSLPNTFTSIGDFLNLEAVSNPSNGFNIGCFDVPGSILDLKLLFLRQLRYMKVGDLNDVIYFVDHAQKFVDKPFNDINDDKICFNPSELITTYNKESDWLFKNDPLELVIAETTNEKIRRENELLRLISNVAISYYKYGDTNNILTKVVDTDSINTDIDKVPNNYFTCSINDNCQMAKNQIAFNLNNDLYGIRNDSCCNVIRALIEKLEHIGKEFDAKIFELRNKLGRKYAEFVEKASTITFCQYVHDTKLREYLEEFSDVFDYQLLRLFKNRNVCKRCNKRDMPAYIPYRILENNQMFFNLPNNEYCKFLYERLSGRKSNISYFYHEAFTITDIPDEYRSTCKSLEYHNDSKIGNLNDISNNNLTQNADFVNRVNAALKVTVPAKTVPQVVETRVAQITLGRNFVSCELINDCPIFSTVEFLIDEIGKRENKLSRGVYHSENMKSIQQCRDFLCSTYKTLSCLDIDRNYRYILYFIYNPKISVDDIESFFYNGCVYEYLDRIFFAREYFYFLISKKRGELKSYFEQDDIIVDKYKFKENVNATRKNFNQNTDKISDKLNTNNIFSTDSKIPFNDNVFSLNGLYNAILRFMAFDIENMNNKRLIEARKNLGKNPETYEQTIRKYVDKFLLIPVVSVLEISFTEPPCQKVHGYKDTFGFLKKFGQNNTSRCECYAWIDLAKKINKSDFSKLSIKENSENTNESNLQNTNESNLENTNESNLQNTNESNLQNTNEIRLEIQNNNVLNFSKMDGGQQINELKRRFFARGHAGSFSYSEICLAKTYNNVIENARKGFYTSQELSVLAVLIDHELAEPFPPFLYFVYKLSELLECKVEDGVSLRNGEGLNCKKDEVLEEEIVNEYDNNPAGEADENAIEMDNEGDAHDARSEDKYDASEEQIDHEDDSALGENGNEDGNELEGEEKSYSFKGSTEEEFNDNSIENSNEESNFTDNVDSKDIIDSNNISESEDIINNEDIIDSKEITDSNESKEITDSNDSEEITDSNDSEDIINSNDSQSINKDNYNDYDDTNNMNQVSYNNYDVWKEDEVNRQQGCDTADTYNKRVAGVDLTENNDKDALAENFDTTDGEKQLIEGGDTGGEADPNGNGYMIERRWRFTEETVSCARLVNLLKTVLLGNINNKYSGDYRTGKKLNLKRIVPYIATDGRKDKIWLRRVKKDKPQYTIRIFIDNSKSMYDQKLVQILGEIYQQLSAAFALMDIPVELFSFGNSLRKCKVTDLTFTDTATRIEWISQFTDGINIILTDGIFQTTHFYNDNFIVIMIDKGNIRTLSKVTLLESKLFVEKYLETFTLKYCIVESIDDLHSVFIKALSDIIRLAY